MKSYKKVYRRKSRRKPDNNTVWPPVPVGYDPGPSQPPANTKAGRVSLILALSVVAALIVLKSIFSLNLLYGRALEDFVFAATLFPLAASFAGFITGVIGRGSILGKVGMSISLLLALWLSLIVVRWFI